MDFEKAGKGFWAFLAKFFNKDFSQIMEQIPQFRAIAEAVEEYVIEQNGAIAITINSAQHDETELGIYAMQNFKPETEALVTFAVPKRKD